MNGDPVIRRAARVGLVVWSAVGLIVLVLAALALLGALRTVVVPLLLAVFATVILAPLNRLMRALGLPPALAALTAIAVLLLALAGLGFIVGQALTGQLEDLGAAASAGYEDVRAWLADESPVPVELGQPEELWERFRSWAIDGDGLGLEPSSLVSTTVEMATGTVLIVVVTFFYLKDGRQLIDWLPNALPAPWSRRVIEAGDAAWASVVGYFRGQMIVALADAVAIGIGLVVLGVPLPLALSVLVFLGGFFPIVGATASGMVAALVALADGGVGLALLVVLLVLAVQQLEGNVLEPYIVGRAARVHPLIVILALAVGAAQAGLLGAFLGVPLAAAAAAIINYIAAEHRRSSEPAPVAAGPAGPRAADS